MEKLLLHGMLHATIYEIDQPEESKISKKDTSKGAPKIYATINLENTMVGRTRIVETESCNPRWCESFHIYCAHTTANVIFAVKGGSCETVLGRAYVPVHELFEGNEIDRWVELLDKDKKPIRGSFRIHVKLQYFDVTGDCSWGRGVGSPKFPGVPRTFFPQREGCQISLYQDAHVPDNFLPKIPLAGEEHYEPDRCWEDIFHAINNAKHLIYIAGWSIHTEISLIRNTKKMQPGEDITLGELLKKKASEGVKVLMLVWREKTAVSPLYEGIMDTKGNKTEQFFRGTKVHCVLCTREPDGGNVIRDIIDSLMFSHHQKTVVVDSELSSGETEKRRIVSFVGGIDLCGGRYDTPFHSLFRTLDTVHHHDFYQPHFTGASVNKGGPREPWHDIHSRLEGPIAWDVLSNFKQRWMKQGGKDILVNLSELEDIIIPPSPIRFTGDHKTWNVQLFRSIDSGAAFGFPDKPEDAARAGLVNGKDNIIERSIQDAYINAIRRAKNFIYIENQYFLGSCFSWDCNDIKVEDVGCFHLIPKELSLKIVSKIEAGERFAVYIVIPMWPEGIPTSENVQAILDWQKRTMEMMYKDIVEALRAKGIEVDPEKFLSFFCLGNREVKRSDEVKSPRRRRASSDHKKAQKARRFMIYVHSKMMIVDDEYIIIGSANINQRSMDGGRDTEVAIGAYQPHHLATKQPATGQVYGFRKALWFEHLHMSDDTFDHPEI